MQLSHIWAQSADYNSPTEPDAFLLFLTELGSSPGTSPTLRVLNWCIARFQGRPPVMSHTELIVFRETSPKGLAPVTHDHSTRNYAIYVNSNKSAWQQKNAASFDYYMYGTHCSKWIAVPVSVTNMNAIRSHCDSYSCEYSFCRYATSIYGFRFFAFLWPDLPKSKAHCATLSARVLKKGKPDCLRHCSAWYSPTSLYKEVARSCADNTGCAHKRVRL